MFNPWTSRRTACRICRLGSPHYNPGWPVLSQTTSLRVSSQPMIRNWFQGAPDPDTQRSGSLLSGARNRLGNRWLAALLGAASSTTLVPLTHAADNAELLSVDFVVGGSGGNGSGQTAPCSGDTALSGSTMNTVAGNLYFGQTGPWNALNIGTYNQNSATSCPGRFRGLLWSALPRSPVFELRC